MSEAKDKFEEWALLELFGHQRIAGKVTEATIGGSSFVRVDVPEFDGQPAFTKYFGNGAIYSLTPVSEAVARGLLHRVREEPINRWDLPQLSASTAAATTEDEDEDE